MRPKIGWIVPGFSADESDWCIPALLDTARVLSETHELHIFTLRYPPEPRRYSVYGAQVHAFGGGTTARMGRVGLMARALRAINAEHRREHFMALHGIWADEPGCVAVAAGRLLRVPTVVSLMGGELIRLPEIGYGHQLSRGARWMIGQSLSAAKVVTVGSAQLKAQAAQYGVDDSKIHITPLGVDVELFRPDGEIAQLAGELKLVHTASLEPIKNQVMLLRAFAQARKRIPGAHLHILGDGRLRADLTALAKSLGIKDAVTFHGAVAHEHLPAYLRAADLCVLTSHHESQSMVALEAAACGRATIGTGVGLLPEIMPDAFLVAPQDVDGLAAVMIRLTEDAALRQQISEDACRRVTASSPQNSTLNTQHYTLDAAVNTWAQLYKMLK